MLLLGAKHKSIGRLKADCRLLRLLKEGNRCADFLANLGAVSEADICYWDVSPSCLGCFA
uniref:Uncharacterized protein n=1 Tax=Rhizophora mucronata TaxID=61149 RepID=A0A2P2PV83_RHIMU